MSRTRARINLLAISTIFYVSLSACLTVNGPTYDAIPDRHRNAASASEFVESISKLDSYQREDAILRELRRGNMPSYLRTLVPVNFEADLKGRGLTRATIWVTPDYLAIGDDQDFVRFPMNPISAQRIADHFGFLLPTKKMVDAIFEQANVKLKPQPMPPDNDMVRTHRFVEHNQKIAEQVPRVRRGDLIAGHKKDIVLTNRIVQRKQTVAIYGWHDTNGKAIQPLSTIHKNYYADYSHGVRLVANMMLVDGIAYPVAEVLQDPILSALISDEGRLSYIRYPTEGTLIQRRWQPR